jgi:nitrous oxidase accessory protein NosD
MLATTPPTLLKPGIVLSKTGTILAKEYSFPTPQGSKKAGDEVVPTLKPAITIKGNNLTIDFAGALLRGSAATSEPDQRKGLGVLVEGNNITIKNLRVRGYKVGLMANNCRGLRILHSDFSYNWKQRLLSTPDKENESDWQSYHHNEHNEWLRYGAGIYLEHCKQFEVSGTKITGGQCGLMLVRSDVGLVQNNDFSFNSGVGLGLYHASVNRVMLNKIDWCVRGFSYGIYNRGQDSAGILIFEKCDGNTFAFNSVTHGGDGFFLWAGQTMMDTGKGGCNGNVLYGNDFSHSPCNAIESTFSSNAFVNNKLVECWHGVWGGYSFDTKIIANVFAFNGEAISIEHGQDNAINHNLFFHENTAINLWQNPIADANWAYPKHHDTVSRDYQIAGNVFDGTTGPAISVKDTIRTMVGGNLFKNCYSALKQSGENTGSQFVLGGVDRGELPTATISPSGRPVSGTSDDVRAYLKRFDIPWVPFVNVEELLKLKRKLSYAEQRVVDGGLSISVDKKHIDPFIKKGALRGQRYILVDQWGPYDFRSPILTPRETVAGGPVGVTRRRFEILGPSGRWRVVSKSGAISLSKPTGTVPGFVDVDFPAKQAAHTDITLEYIGAATTDYRGIVTPAGKPVAFGYHRFFAPIDWDVKFFKWDDTNDPRTKPAEFAALIAGQPVKELHRDKLDFAGGTFDPAVGADHFATICNGSFTVPSGKYMLELTTDDGARVWVDGKPVIRNAWKYQGPTLYEAKLMLDGKRHTIRVEHFQIDGYAALKVDLNPDSH